MDGFFFKRRRLLMAWPIFPAAVLFLGLVPKVSLATKQQRLRSGMSEPVSDLHRGIPGSRWTAAALPIKISCSRPLLFSPNHLTAKLVCVQRSKPPPSQFPHDSGSTCRGWAEAAPQTSIGSISARKQTQAKDLPRETRWWEEKAGKRGSSAPGRG